MSQHLFLKASSSFGTLGPRHYKLRDTDIYIKLISICNGKTRVCTANVLHVAALSLKASSFIVASLCCTAPVFNYFTVRHSVSEETRSTKQRNHCVPHGVTACTHTPSASSTARCSGRCCQAINFTAENNTVERFGPNTSIITRIYKLTRSAGTEE